MMVEEFKEYKCTYTTKWPIDEYGRLGGMYSLSDLPISGYVELERDGFLVKQDSKRGLYEVRDAEKKFVTRLVEQAKVKNIEEVE